MNLRLRARNSPIYQKNKFQPALLAGFYTNANSCEHRERRSEIDPVAYCLTIRVAKLLTKNPPIFLDKQDNEIEKIKEGWVKNDYDAIFQEVIRLTRIHGCCVTESLKTPFASRDFLVHGFVDMIRINYDERWNIKSYTILPKMEAGEKLSSVHLPEQYNLDSSKALHFEVGVKKKNQQGLSILKPVWAQMVRANEILESMAAYDARIGHGIIVTKIDPALYQDDMADLIDSVRTMNNRRYIILKQKKDSPVEMKYIGAEGTKMDFPRDLESILGFISSATGFVVRFFIGDPKGALSASEEDKVAIYQNLQSIFAEYKDWIRKFIEKFMENGEAISAKIHSIEFDHEGILDSLTDDMDSEQEGEEAKQTKYTANEAQKKVTK